MKTKYLYIIILTLVFLIVSACGIRTPANSATNGGGGVTPPAATPNALQSISITPGAVSIGINGTQQLTATGHYSDFTAHDISNSVTWIISNPAVASVSNTGLLKGLSLGTTNITASKSGITSNTITANVINLKIVNIPTNDLIYNPTTQKIYASVPSTASGGIANSIVIIDPLTGASGPSIFIGNEPRKLAISDDGVFLYVTLGTLNAVQRVNVSTATPTLDIQFSLGNDPASGLATYAEDIAVMPGNNQTVAISKKFNGFVSPRFAGLSIYDNGVPRPISISWPIINTIEFSNASSTLYGYEQEISSFTFSTISVNASGVIIASTAATAITGYGVDIKYAGGAVYSTIGVVINPVTSGTIGTFLLPTVYDNFIYPDSIAGKFYSLSPGNTRNQFNVITQYILRSYNINTFALLNSIMVENVVTNTSVPIPVGSLITCGVNTLAFRTSGDQIYIIGAP